MDLQSHQRTLLELMRSNTLNAACDDSYFLLVARSPDLREARGNVFLWLEFVLERTCVLTVELLRQRGFFTQVLEDFIRLKSISPFREYQPPSFLSFAASQEDSLVAAVSSFELAMLKVRDGDQGQFRISWPADPRPILYALLKRSAIKIPEQTSAFCTEVCSSLPHHFEVRPLK